MSVSVPVLPSSNEKGTGDAFMNTLGVAADDLGVEAATDDLGVVTSDDLGVVTAAADLGVEAAADDLGVVTAAGNLGVEAVTDEVFNVFAVVAALWYLEAP